MSTRKLLSLIFNLTAIVSAIVGLFLVPGLQAIHFVKFFTLVTNTLIILMSAVTLGYMVDALVKKKADSSLPSIVYVMKLITAVCSMITFLTVVLYLQYAVDGMNTFYNFLFHYIAPLAFVAGFIFTDIDRKYPIYLHLFGIGALVIYMLYAIPLANIPHNVWGDPQAPYPFMNLSLVKWWALLLFPFFLLCGHLIAFLLWLFNRLSYLVFAGTEIKTNEKFTKEEKRIENKVQVTPEDEKAVAEMMKTAGKGPRVYHISKRKDNKWQVKFANGKRAIRLFPTQAEAIVFAKKLAKSQDGSIRIHSVKGRIRKEH